MHNRIFFFGFSVLVLVLVGLQTVPINKQKSALIDETISSDLTEIDSKVTSYSTDKGKLPTSLSDLALNKTLSSHAAKYHYEIKARSVGTNYELCATFKTDTTKQTENSYFSSYRGSTGSGSSDVYNHKSGNQCFSFSSYVNGYNGSGSGSSSPYDGEAVN